MTHRKFMVAALALLAAISRSPASQAGDLFTHLRITPDRLVFLPETCLASPLFARCVDSN